MAELSTGLAALFATESCSFSLVLDQEKASVNERVIHYIKSDTLLRIERNTRR